MSPEHAIFGNLSRKTELMGDLSSVDGEATPYHLPWGGTEAEGADGVGVPSTGLGITHLLCSLQSKHGGSGQAGLALATTPIYTLAQPPPPRGGPRGPSSKIPSGRGLDCTTLWSRGREGGPRSHLDLGFPTIGDEGLTPRGGERSF